MSEELKVLKSIESKLDQLLRWTRFAGMQQLRTILTQNLTRDIEMLIYELSDGERSTREIAALVGIKSHVRVADYWKKWSKLGIVEPSGKYPGRYRRVCSLEEIGLTVPSLPGKPPEEHPAEEIADE
ncbi:MAG: hypothetical protein ACPLKQ_07210 [Candidatus Bathyarchaeales archaeon]